ncbi:MAG: DUF2158 domain-containing protein [Rhodomicrobium sp.]|jgi:uncharacterized protein YodC (DUF2158 family)
MKKDDIKVGDVVELISGGPPMTVAEVNVNLVGDCEVVCRWFFGRMEKGSFAPDVLKPGKARPLDELRAVAAGPAPEEE